MSVRVGELSLLKNTPQVIELDNQPYILSRNPEGEPVVFDAICPHQGGTVDIENQQCLRCPDHGWEFDSETGNSTTPDESLTVFSVEERDGYLFADIPDIDLTVEFTVDDHHAPRPTVSVLSHATLRVDYDGFTFLTDPWLDGPAFLGGWTQYPQPTCDIDETVGDTDAIWITHEHSDHLNPRTLSHFPLETPIYIPELNYRRLSTRLRELGFKNIYSLPTEEPYQIADGIEAVSFESRSTWNDSILALNCGGFRILNFNDAGLNWRVKDAIPSADLIATSFSFGASGYPLTWNHITDEEKSEIMKSRNIGALQHCEQTVEMFNADYLLPFAKFFELLRPESHKYRSMIRVNRPRDVVDYFDNQEVQVLDLFPGESWNGNTHQHLKREDRQRIYKKDYKEKILKKVYDSHTPIVRDEFDLSHSELEEYFENLSGSELADEIDNHAFSLILSKDGTNHNALIRFQNGDVQYEATDEPVESEEVNASTYVKMAVDGILVQHVVRHDLSWDEIHIGYWADFSRHPDEYNLPFWRLLHAPWEARKDRPKTVEEYDIETEITGIPMAELIEEHDIGEVLSDYGLFCAGCPTGLGEDVEEAARIHGLSKQQAKELIRRIESQISDSFRQKASLGE